ncbi:MAG TPA: apolipoprotein N-acyltransferase [Steroidobacteraceae bacterium]|nr:apolipoprotein N-acyltransferase [Steroidobacteraceae bacterium]
MSTLPPLVQSLLLSVLSAVLYFTTFLNFDFYPLIWICFVPVLCAIRDVTPRRALLIGTVFGLVTNAGGYYWVVHTIGTFGNMPLAVAVLGYLLLCLYQGFLLAIVLALVRRAQQQRGIAPVWSLAVVFPAIELAYPLLFPSYIGNSQLEFNTITQFVDITGMAGLTLLIGLVNGGIYEIIEARLQTRRIQPLRLAVPAVAFLTCAIYGFIRLPQVDAMTASAPKATVGIIQTNIGARDKAADPEEFVVRHQVMSQQVIAAHPEVDLIVWPESAYNQLLPRARSNLKLEVMRGIDRPLLFGALTYGPSREGATSQIFNSLLLADGKGNVLSTYDKIELLVFGETYPFSATLPFLERVFGTNWFTRGTALHHLRLGDDSFMPLICFEDILPSLVRRLWKEAGPADVLVNGTNDSWYGNTDQPMIHLALASFRSIETRRALIRSTNTGISAIVDPAGRITHRTGQWTRETLVADVPMIKNGSTTVFMKVGNVVGWLCVILTAFGWWRSRPAKAAE